MSDWEDLIGVGNARPVWKGTMKVVSDPVVYMWWQAWMALDGGLNVLHVGVTAFPRGASGTAHDAVELQELSRRMLGGILDMGWRTIGDRVPLETVPVAWRKSPVNGKDSWSGKVVAKADDGRLFEPFMTAVMATKEAV